MEKVDLGFFFVNYQKFEDMLLIMLPQNRIDE